jgi:hypothetical protein
MYGAIRRYTIKGTTAEALARQADEAIVPGIREIPGFIAYYMVAAPDDVITTVSIFETQEGAGRSTRLATEWVTQNLRPFVASGPQITTGAVLLQSHAGREAAAGR